jgi:hypothetical protein
VIVMPDLFDNPVPIKAISLWQPWAWLFCLGLKGDETRHWSTEYRGPIAIHAARRLDVAGAPERLCQAAGGRDWRDRVPLGAIVAVATLKEVRPAAWAAERSTRANLAAGNFTAGRFAWRLVDVRPLRAPIALCGRQGLFNWTPPAALELLLAPPVDHFAACRRIGWA